MPTVAIWVQLAIKHPVPDWVKPPFVIFDIRALWRSELSVRLPRMSKNTSDGLTVWHRMLYSLYPYGNSGRQRVNCTVFKVQRSLHLTFSLQHAFHCAIKWHCVLCVSAGCAGTLTDDITSKRWCSTRTSAGHSCSSFLTSSTRSSSSATTKSRTSHTGCTLDPRRTLDSRRAACLILALLLMQILYYKVPTDCQPSGRVHNVDKSPNTSTGFCAWVSNGCTVIVNSGWVHLSLRRKDNTKVNTFSKNK